MRGQSRNLRGGSFNNNERNARCAYRNRNQPDDHNDNNGFRVVLSTPFRFAVSDTVGRKCGAGGALRRHAFADEASAAT